MRILCITSRVHPCTLGGIETFCRMMKKMYKKELYFFSFSTKRKKYYETADIIEFETKNIFEKAIYKLTGRSFLTKNKLKKLEYDFCILNFPKDIKLLPRTKQSINILVQHMNFDNYMDEYFYHNSKLIKKIKEKIDCFIVLSEQDRKRFIKELNFDENKIKTIRHTCNMELFEGSKVKNKKLIMICKLDNYQKRIDLAIKAMKLLPDYTLNIYGEGKDKEKLENIIKEHELKNVFLCGGTNQVKEKLDESSIFVLTSDYEGYGIVNIEAMRRGLPVILRNTFEAASDIIISENGILLEKEWNENKFAEAVKKVYNNYKFYSQNALEVSKRYDIKIIKSEWDKLFEQLNKI